MILTVPQEYIVRMRNFFSMCDERIAYAYGDEHFRIEHSRKTRYYPLEEAAELACLAPSDLEDLLSTSWFFAVEIEGKYWVHDHAVMEHGRLTLKEAVQQLYVTSKDLKFIRGME